MALKKVLLGQRCGTFGCDPGLLHLYHRGTPCSWLTALFLCCVLSGCSACYVSPGQWQFLI